MTDTMEKDANGFLRRPCRNCTHITGYRKSGYICNRLCGEPMPEKLAAELRALDAAHDRKNEH